MKHSKKLVTLSVLTTMSGAAIYFLNKTLDTAAVRKNLLASAEKEIFSWQFGDIFYTKKAPEPRCSYFMTYIVPPAAANGSILRILSQRITPSTHSIFSLRPFRQAGNHVHELFIRTAHRHLHQAGHRMSNRRNCIRFIRFFRRNRLQYSPEMLRPNHDDQPDRPCQAQQNSG